MYLNLGSENYTPLIQGGRSQNYVTADRGGLGFATNIVPYICVSINNVHNIDFHNAATLGGHSWSCMR